MEQTRQPSRLPRAARREQLLDVTKEIVGERGLHAVSIDAVARRAGITRPVVYEHFSDLEGLLRALLEREAARALAQLATFMPTALEEREVLDALLSALRGYLEAVRADPVTWRLVLVPTEGAPAYLQELVEQGRRAVVAQLTALIAQASPPPGGRRSPDPELTASSLSALADHFARLMLTDPEHYGIERLLVHARWAIGSLAAGSWSGEPPT